jgi:hypothetical protein
MQVMQVPPPEDAVTAHGPLGLRVPSFEEGQLNEAALAQLERGRQRGWFRIWPCRRPLWLAAQAPVPWVQPVQPAPSRPARLNVAVAECVLGYLLVLQ